ncbi:hypothetical protein U14_01469 [Candidatus Moduliflexus flocculans]|uniref:Uncharacterized protein n=1 Tax=Candidatus Moduliflexus flocculans TaxID=1499966 RepID=A0A0S6VSD4_9BACT|nr:hypothetical protein U14_01469 [Candidatus Moduliflexus flocculans]
MQSGFFAVRSQRGLSDTLKMSDRPHACLISEDGGDSDHVGDVIRAASA